MFKEYYRGKLLDMGNNVSMHAWEKARREIDKVVDEEERIKAEERKHRQAVEIGANNQIDLLTQQLSEAKKQNNELTKINKSLKTAVEKHEEQIREMREAGKQTKTWAIVSTAIATVSFLAAVVGIVLAAVL